MLPVPSDQSLRQRFDQAGCIFFDCDGVLFDSNGFKIDAMRHALAGHPDVELDAMLEYWKNQGGASRWVKFRYFFERIAPTKDVDAAVGAACERFGFHSLRSYDTCDPVPLALEVIRRAGPNRAVVVSGASEVELHSVFRKKRITELFSAVLGSPRTKLELMRGVLAERGLRPGETLFFGDGAGDFRVASELGTPFVYLDQFTEWPGARATMQDAPGVTWADDWAEIIRALDASTD